MTMTRLRIRNLIMLRLSALMCGMSVLVLVVMLFQSNTYQNTALATNYNADQVILSVNNHRINNGLQPLIVNDLLMKSAQNKANHMAENEYFSHIGYGKKWSDFIREAGYDYAEAGENLANGFDRVDDMTIAWMESPSHRENIVNAGVTDTGVGVAFGKLDGYPTIFVVQVFGRELVRDTPIATESVESVVATPLDTSVPADTQPQPASGDAQPTATAPKPKTLGDLLVLPETIAGQ